MYEGSTKFDMLSPPLNSAKVWCRQEGDSDPANFPTHNINRQGLENKVDYTYDLANI